MARPKKIDIELQQSEWILTKLMFELIDGGKEFCADDLVFKAHAHNVPPRHLTTLVPALFRRFSSRKTQYIRQTGNYRTSERAAQDSSPLRLWVSNKITDKTAF